jgi:RNA polymerase sigma-70 factor (ECF subfamily)
VIEQATMGVRGLNTSADKVLETTDNSQPDLDRFLAESADRAFHIAYGALWDRELALDVVQEAMLKLVEYYRDRPAGQWPALFRTVLNSKINDQRRRRMLEQGKLKLLSLTGLGHNSDADPVAEADVPAGEERDDRFSAQESALHAADLGQRIDSAMQTLPWRQRQVFLLRERKGLSIKETAEMLGCSENSVKQHHFRAMRGLRDQLAEVWEHE